MLKSPTDHFGGLGLSDMNRHTIQWGCAPMMTERSKEYESVVQSMCNDEAGENVHEIGRAATLSAKIAC